LCANYAKSSDLEKKRAADALFRAYSLANPDYTLAGLLESLKSIELSRQLALGNVSAPRSSGKPSRLVPTKVAWIKEKENQEKLRQESIAESNSKQQAADEKRINSLKAKYRGVRLRAESGSSEAMLELSEMLRKGIGCEMNLEEADQWLRKSTQNVNN
jgi:TPR repeat protein